MCVSLRKHDEPLFLPVGGSAMATMFPIPVRFAQSPASGLSRRGTMFIALRRALEVTCATPLM